MERIVSRQPSHYHQKMILFQVSLMRCNTIRKMYSTERKGHLTICMDRTIVKPSGPLTIIERSVFSLVSLMRCNIPSVSCILQTVRALNDPYGWNELIVLTDHYNAGVLDNPLTFQHFNSNQLAWLLVFQYFFSFKHFYSYSSGENCFVNHTKSSSAQLLLVLYLPGKNFPLSKRNNFARGVS